MMLGALARHLVVILPTRTGTSAFAALAAVLLTSVPAAQATFPGPDGAIAYIGRDELGNANVYAVRPDGTGSAALTLYCKGPLDSIGALPVNPDWAAGGSRLAFSRQSTQSIEVVGRNGEEPRPLTRADNDPAWDATGARVAFTG